MHKLLLCVPMMTLALLSACGGGGAQGSAAEELALTIRGEYLAQTAWTCTACVTADYGQRVYQYDLTAVCDGEETTLSLTAPETVAGMTAHLKGTDSQLEYDGLWVETGPLDEEGLTPVSALPVLVEGVRSGYITACALDETTGQLRLDCGDPEQTPGTGRELSLWLDGDSHALVRGEISKDGFCVIQCEITDFTKG